jgi:hypothetical protein
MGRGSEFDNILDECLELVLKGEGVEACLARYPEHAAELEPLLRTALETRKAMSVGPRPEFRQRAGYEFQAAIRGVKPRGGKGFFRWHLRWAAPVALIIGILMIGSGTVTAASSSLPDETLYPVKLAAESVQIAFTPSALDKAELYARFADRRVAEIIKMADRGKVEQVEKTTKRMDKQLIAMANLAAPTTGVSESAEVSALQVPAPAPPAEAAPKAAVREAPVPAPAPAPSPAPAAAPAPEPAPAVEETPSLMQAPAPVITVPPPSEEASVAQAPQAPAPVTKGITPEKKRVTKDWGEKSEKQEKLRTILSRQAARNSEALRERLEKASELLKPVLRRALEVADRGYEQALENLD